MADSQLYSRLLLPKGHGYPLFHPQPYDDLQEIRRTGTQIGDVGVVKDGCFDVAFNICNPADHPINRRFGRGLPEGFEPLALLPGDIALQASYHPPGADVSNVRINKRRLDIDVGVENNVFLPAGAGAVVEISASSKETAVLILQDGASRVDLRGLQTFRDYALKHAQSWYAFVNGRLGWMVPTGDLYLITGVDKSSKWSVAAWENRTEDLSLCLKLKAAQFGSAAGSCTWEWETATSFAKSGPAREPHESPAKDQTLFLRGFKVAIRPSPRKSAKAISIVDSKPSSILSKSSCIPFSKARSNGAVSFFWNLWTTCGGGGSSDDQGSAEYFPNCPKAHHPGSVVNEYLLSSLPSADVAVTHDNEWASVLSDDETLPADSELIERISRRYETYKTADGVALDGLVEPIDAESSLRTLEEYLLDSASDDECTSDDGADLLDDSQPTGYVSGTTNSPGTDGTRNKKALLVGISYANSPEYAPLTEAHSDVDFMQRHLIETCGYSASDIVTLRDAVGNQQPTRTNILSAIDALVQGAQVGDQLSFHYCGYSTQMGRGANGVEDECLIPTDGKDHVIRAAELHSRLVGVLPIGSSLVAVLNTCHSVASLEIKHESDDLTPFSPRPSPMDGVSDCDNSSSTCCSPTPSPIPFSLPTKRIKFPGLQSQATKDVLCSVLKVRKSWKTLRGGESVWPLDLEAALLEGLERYKPDNSRETRMLGRFPQRNRFISDYIFEKTGKRRTAKQVGSRLQQLRESCGNKKLLHLLSPFRKPAYSESGSLYSPMSSAGDDFPPNPSSSGHSVMYIDILPEGSLEPSLGTSNSSPWSDTGIVHTPDYPRPLKSINPTVSFTSSVPIVAQSRFTVYSEGLILHAEIVPLVPVLDHAPEGSGLLYSTPLVPKYWRVILDSPDPTRFTICQEVLNEETSAIVFSRTYKFRYPAPPNPYHVAFGVTNAGFYSFSNDLSPYGGDRSPTDSPPSAPQRDTELF